VYARSIPTPASSVATKAISGRRAAQALAAMALAALSPVAAGQDAAAPGATAPWLTPAATYDGTALGDLRGGSRTGATYVGNLHLKLNARFDAIGAPGTSAFVDVLTIHGGQPSGYVGDAMGTSSLAGPVGTQVEELWLQHNFTGSVSLLAGIYDLNSEFYRLEGAGLFLNSAFGIGPEFGQSGVEGPSIFPRTAAGLRGAFKPAAGTVLRAAVLDGVPVVRPDGSRAVFRGGDGLLAVAEFATLSRAPADPGPTTRTRDRVGRFSSLAPYDDKLAIGTWHYTAEFADLSDTDPAGNPRLRHGTSGTYAVGERLLIGRDGSSAKRLSAFVQIGIADPRTNRFGTYLGVGIAASGWGPLGNSDQLGASIAQAKNGSHYRQARLAHGEQGVDDAETTFELTYLTPLSAHFTVQPDLQYVIHPNTDPALANAWVLQLRFEIAF
jgi:porin